MLSPCRLHWWPDSMPNLPECLLTSMSQHLVHPATNKALRARLAKCDAKEMATHLHLVKLDEEIMLRLMSQTCFSPLAFPGGPILSEQQAVSYPNSYPDSWVPRKRHC